MKRLSLPFLCATFCLLLLASTSASAQIRLGSHLAIDFDGTEVGIGVNAHVGFTAGEKQLLANPSVDFYIFNKNVTITRINLDVALPFAAGEMFTPFVGGGILVQRISIDVDPEFQIPGIDYNDTDFGLNLFVGSFFMSEDSPIRPFGRFAANVGAGTGLSVQGGASFRISK